MQGGDPDGDTVTWTLAFGDGNATNGTALPATLGHTYGAAGNYTAMLTLDDGVAQTTYTAQVSVPQSAPSGT